MIARVRGVIFDSTSAGSSVYVSSMSAKTGTQFCSSAPMIVPPAVHGVTMIFVARLRIEGANAHVHRRGPRRHRDGVLHPMAGRKRPLERIDLRPLAHVPRPHHLGQRRNILIPKRMPRPKRLRANRRPTMQSPTARIIPRLPHRPPDACR